MTADIAVPLTALIAALTLVSIRLVVFFFPSRDVVIPTPPPPIPASVRGELDCTPDWWDAQYDALVKKQIPRDAASHAGHDIERDEWTQVTAGGAIVYRASRPWCSDCGVELSPS